MPEAEREMVMRAMTVEERAEAEVRGAREEARGGLCRRGRGYAWARGGG